MSEPISKRLGRPKKKPRHEWSFADFKTYGVELDEVMRCYSHMERGEIAGRETERFLQGSGVKDKQVENACAHVEVFALFVLARLFGSDPDKELGGWANRGEWSKLDCWKVLLARWERNWEKARRGKQDQSGFTSVWRLALMVSAWRLLDEYPMPSENGGVGYPLASEIMEASKLWLVGRGVCVTASDNILAKTPDRLREIGLGWIPRMGMKDPCHPLYPEGMEPVIKLHCTPEEMMQLEEAVSEYDSEGAARERLEFLSGLDWPSAAETEMPR